MLTRSSQDYMASLVPHLNYVTSDAAQPHPSVTFAFTVQPEHCNRFLNIHGGCAATLFDFCTTLPIALVNRPGFWRFLGVSRTLNITYLRPVPAETEVLIHAEILQIGKKMATLRGTMRRRSDGAIMAICEHGKFNVDPEEKL
jgi:acyl-coenzyme A thioesterase 13